MQSLERMMIFAKVIETGSFSRAAQQLGIAKSSVSKKIVELENELGVRLIQRTTRKLSVTEEGKALHQHCLNIRLELEQAKLQMSLYREAPQGVLRINASPLFGNTVIAPLIPGFLALYPEVKVELYYSQQVTDIVAENYDLALRMGHLADSSLIATELFMVRSLLCAAPEYLKRQGRPEHPNDIEHHTYIRWLAPGRPPYEYITFQKSNREYSCKINSRFSTSDAQATLKAVLLGAGLAMLPNYAVCDDVKEGRLEILLPDYQVTDLPMSLIYPQRTHVSPKVRAFSDYLKQHIKAMNFAVLG